MSFGLIETHVDGMSPGITDLRLASSDGDVVAIYNGAKTRRIAAITVPIIANLYNGFLKMETTMNANERIVKAVPTPDSIIVMLNMELKAILFVSLVVKFSIGNKIDCVSFPAAMILADTSCKIP